MVGVGQKKRLIKNTMDAALKQISHPVAPVELESPWKQIINACWQKWSKIKKRHIKCPCELLLTLHTKLTMFKPKSVHREWSSYWSVNIVATYYSKFTQSCKMFTLHACVHVSVHQHTIPKDYEKAQQFHACTALRHTHCKCDALLHLMKHFLFCLTNHCHLFHF